MNYMNQVAEMLGVEIGEEFSICGDDGLREYYFSESGEFWCKKDNGVDTLEPRTLLRLLCGEVELVKKPWSPSEKELFYYVTPSGDIQYGSYDHLFVLHPTLTRLGNSYRTKQEITPEIAKGWAHWYDGGENPSEVSE